LPIIVQNPQLFLNLYSIFEQKTVCEHATRVRLLFKKRFFDSSIYFLYLCTESYPVRFFVRTCG